MKNKKRIRETAGVCALVLLGFLSFTVPPALGRGDEALLAAFPSDDTRDTHESMTGQRKTLAVIQNAYLAADTEALEEQVNALARGMQAASRSIPETATEDAEMWTLLYKIVTEARAMKESTDKKDYAGAYDHYLTLTAQCILCHQRGMGASAAPEPEGQPAAQEERIPNEGHPTFEDHPAEESQA